MNEITFMQMRLIRMAVDKWQKSTAECAKIFACFNLYAYIESLYEVFHLQGDEANFAELEEFMASKVDAL